MEHMCVHTHAHAHRKKKTRLILGDLISSGIHRNHGTAKKEGKETREKRQAHREHPHSEGDGHLQRLVTH